MSDIHNKRKYAGPPVNELRKDEPRDKRHLSPHQKPRKYRLTVRYVKVNTETCTKEFTSKAAMQEFRTRIEREIAKLKAAPPRRSWRYWGNWWSTDLKMESETRDQLKSGPEISEEMIDG